MKKTLFVLLAVVFVLAMMSVAYATDPADDTDTPFTFVETPTNTPPEALGSGEYNPNIPVAAAGGFTLSGASAWTYMDTSDAAAKYEGSYKAFDSQSKNLYDLNSLGRDRGPHGEYGTSTNKCDVCHAVHRAEGANMLMRVDTADDACSYCHVGDHRHSVVSAYWRAGNIRPANGHTIGSGKEIPDSSVWQWREEKTLTSVSLSDPAPDPGVEGVNLIKVRRYSAERLKLMKIAKTTRFGPTYLRCQSCHQVHNASMLIWKPYDSAGVAMSNGYKLLRNSPAGNIQAFKGYAAGAYAGGNTNAPKNNLAVPGDINDDGTLKEVGLRPSTVAREGNTAYARTTVDPDGVPGNNDDYRVTVDPIVAIDSTYTNEGVVAGVFTDWTKGHGSSNTTGYSTVINPLYNFDPLVSRMPRVEETSLSYWCANCHNLNIAGKEDVESNFGAGANGETMLVDRSHVTPWIEQEEPCLDGYHCYSCHNNDMARIMQVGVYANYNGTGADVYHTYSGCGNCHITPPMYRAYKQTYRTFQGVAGGNSLSDFPHSGSSVGFKLLNDVDTLTDPYAKSPSDPTNPAPKLPTNPAFHTPFRPATDGLDKVCGICHLPGGTGSHALGIVK